MNSHPWSHFLSNDSVNYSIDSQRRPESLMQTRQDTMGEATLFGGSSTSSTAMGVLNTTSTSNNTADGSSLLDAHARRNLTEAFEELYVETPQNVATPTTSTKEQQQQPQGESLKLNEVSPTGVTDLHVVTDSESRDSPETASNVHVARSDADHDESSEDDLPHFELHASLQRDLSQALVNRVSFYGVIHDINKEANSMATCDTSSFARSCDQDNGDEEFSPLVVAVNGTPSRPMPTNTPSMIDTAVIDEEKWLLAAIEARGEDESRSIAACPPTFLQAMGEREYDNPLSSMETSRTQLWKPSRSWWEAKSGKNPWIEPTSHNKRWRYLWPLIHYHKFLAKCIKKLKRNGVDVKTSVSPVAVFLREEVCAVSDHLASVSLFKSEEWMECLVHFSGWTDHSPVAEKRLRMLVSRLSLRPLAEPGDVDSPLLRSQVDEHFLRAMASAREQMTNGGLQQERANLVKNVTAGSNKPPRKIPPTGRNKIPLHPQRVTPAPSSYPAPANQSSATAAEAAYGKGGEGQQPYGYPGHGGQWWNNGWPQYVSYDESGSVQSALSGDSYLQHYNEYGVYPGATPGPYYGPPQDRSEYYYGPQGPYPPPPPGMTPEGWMPHPPSGDVNSGYTSQTSEGSGYMHPPGTPNSHSSPSPHRNYNPYQFSPGHIGAGFAGDNRVTPNQTPHKSPYPQNGVPSSPYWGHLDQATLAMTGLVTPHGKFPETPQRPARPLDEDGDDAQEVAEGEEDGHDSPDKSQEDFANAKPLLMNNWSSQYYPHGSQYGARESYAAVPPSPATQFMMSPQASSQAAAYYAHNYSGGAYGFSPHRHGWRQPHDVRHTPPSASTSPQDGNGAELETATAKETTTDVTPPPIVRKITEKGRESPVTTATIETMAETESIVES